jgi:pyruvate/2-oxoglutarate dehydrogenase complex dihydrolipoamide acyltransferase (E2) component
MARKVDILAPYTQNGGSALIVQRWLKMIGDTMLVNEPIAELVGNEMIVYVHAPSEGSLANILVPPGQNILSGAVLGHVSVVAKDAIEWDNFDEVTTILEEFAEKSKDRKQLKDANEALGQLLGVTDKDIFRTMNIEQQNKFLQNVVDQHKAYGLSPADVAQQLLVGLQLRPPVNVPSTPAPAFGIRGPSAPGMAPGGGGVHYTGATPQQQQGYAPPAQAPTNWPSMPQQGQIPPPYMPVIPKSEDDK